MNTYVKEYTSFMTDIRHKSLNTVESYKRDVTQYISYLDGTGVTDISSTTKTTVLSYLLYLQKEILINSGRYIMKDLNFAIKHFK